MRRDPSVLDLFVRSWPMGQPLNAEPLPGPSVPPRANSLVQVAPAPEPSTPPKKPKPRTARRRIRPSPVPTRAERKALDRVAMVQDFGRRAFTSQNVSDFIAGPIETSSKVWFRILRRKWVKETNVFPFLKLTKEGERMRQ